MKMPFLSVLAKRSLPLLFACLVSSCAMTRYEYVAPASDSGRLCASQCAGVREQCRANEINRGLWERDMCERRNASMYHSCLAYADSKKEARECDRYRNSCWSSESSWRCDDAYRQCYTACGGKVITITE